MVFWKGVLHQCHHGVTVLLYLIVWYLPYNKDLKAFSRHLRNNSTLGEVLLWMQLRAGQLKGYKFNRQKPLGNYIVDFYCKRLNLVIEVDGGLTGYRSVTKPYLLN